MLVRSTDSLQGVCPGLAMKAGPCWQGSGLATGTQLLVLWEATGARVVLPQEQGATRCLRLQLSAEGPWQEPGCWRVQVAPWV